jgi:diaminohydroxyphosphoribosylaminopyrimidine deaminase/5-amino-6-(5-phosphoribosylamino)uracil reductase
MKPEQQASERFWMEQALALAALGEGRTSPNPLVGCVLLRGDRVVGRGWHRAPGEPHAEAIAVAEAGEQARGATAYVNLEPCAHSGLTPPCADTLIRSGVARVVAAVRDPNPLVDGKGIERLRAENVEVEIGLLAEQAEELNAPFLHWHRTGRPLVTLKAAISLDGMLAARDGCSQWISGPVARRFAHRLRLRHDAVLVGGETARRDDPRLTVRLPGPACTKLRVVLSASLNLDPSLELFQGPPTRVYTTVKAADAAKPLGVAEIVGLPGDADGHVDLCAMLDHLGRSGVQSLLVEGGAKTFGAFLSQSLADRAAIFVTGKLIGSVGATSLFSMNAATEPAQAIRLSAMRHIPLGPDLLICGRVTGG